ncbi:C6 finger domain-containing protein [Apiospora aurea]|uniref:C6 finger domain-containing protein n=1 Tax=Apiospora aurea TaxID=335848 RepID=A0ABR1QJE2_9PEZI
MASAEVEAQASTAARPRSRDTSPSREQGDEDSGPKKTAVRKRTKTGCLTCRKRRIKCDEGRPTCNNCIKSKRQCEGYNQRVIFKEPLGAFAAQFGPLVYAQPSPQALVREQQLSAAQKSNAQSLQIIAPKPPPLGYHPGVLSPFDPVYNARLNPMPLQSPPLGYDPNLCGLQHPPPTATQYPYLSPESDHGFPQSQWRQGPQVASQLDFSSLSPPEYGPHTQSSVSPTVLQYANASLDGSIPVQLEREASDDTVIPAVGSQVSPVPDDDALMGDSDDEGPIDRHDSAMRLNQLGMVAAQRASGRFDILGTQPRTFSGYADAGVLVSYEPDPAHSPLNDRKIAAVFWHFVNVTGPSISIYERHSFDATLARQGQNVQARQHIWAFKFPLMAFSHPALLQAMLALASLQIAKLQQVPQTASLKHYHLSLRRVARNIGRPGRRNQPSNLAATLLLAYYEVWNSDHEKWSKHLLGARWIIRDIPFRQMTRSVMIMQRRRRQQAAAQHSQQERSANMGYGEPVGTFGTYDGPSNQSLEEEEEGVNPMYRDWDQLDVQLLTELTGKHTTFDELGMGPETPPFLRPAYQNTVTEKDVDEYEKLSDLYWWYCKMDIYQHILGGTKLFMEYDHWLQCPPRAPIGRSDAIYGTYDHLMLLLGRLASFTSGDLSRKRRVFSLRGTFGGSGAPPGTFPGMVPSSGRVPMPMGFSPQSDAASPKSDVLEDSDLDELTIAAHREWAFIKHAFEVIQEKFGPEFAQVPPGATPPVPTPFGLAAQYSTYGVAGIWLNYYMGLISLHRAHPEMPPVAMMAAGMSAHQTMGYAIEVGRIVAGLDESTENKPAVSTVVGAAFIESSFPMFVAAIQLQSEDQRHWVVRRMHDIARLTGWQSARQIASGAESAWTKAAQMGQGPPYNPPADLDRSDPSVGAPSIWGQPRSIKNRIQEVSADESNKLVLAKSERAFYALGLLGVQDELEKLDLVDSEDKGKQPMGKPSPPGLDYTGEGAGG